MPIGTKRVRLVLWPSEMGRYEMDGHDYHNSIPLNVVETPKELPQVKDH